MSDMLKRMTKLFFFVYGSDADCEHTVETLKMRRMVEHKHRRDVMEFYWSPERGENAVFYSGQDDHGDYTCNGITHTYNVRDEIMSEIMYELYNLALDRVADMLEQERLEREADTRRLRLEVELSAIGVS